MPVVAPQGPAGRRCHGRYHRRRDPQRSRTARREAGVKSRLPAFVRLIVLALLVAFVISPQTFAWLFEPLTKNGQPPIYTQNSLLDLALNHLAIVAVA